MIDNGGIMNSKGYSRGTKTGEDLVFEVNKKSNKSNLRPPGAKKTK